MTKPIEIMTLPVRRLLKVTFTLRAGVAVLFLIGATVPGSSVSVSAQTLDDYDRQRVFDFEQCANACQIELDQQLFACAPYREDKSRPAPEDCYESNYGEYERCMNACPLDPRLQP